MKRHILISFNGLPRPIERDWEFVSTVGWEAPKDTDDPMLINQTEFHSPDTNTYYSGPWELSPPDNGGTRTYWNMSAYTYKVFY